MKLDLLYEIDVPYPWSDKPHPYAQREAEQEAYRNTIEQVKAADKLGLKPTTLESRMAKLGLKRPGHP